MLSSANGATRAPSHAGAGMASSSRKATMSVSHSRKPRFLARLRPGTGSTMYCAENSAAACSVSLSPAELSMTRILSGAGSSRATAARHFASRPARFLVQMTTVTVREFSLNWRLDELWSAFCACDVTCGISNLSQRRTSEIVRPALDAGARSEGQPHNLSLSQNQGRGRRREVAGCLSVLSHF